MEENVITGIDVQATGRRIRQLMDERGLQVSTISRNLDLSDQAVYKWLSGESLPTLENAVILSQMLDTDVDDMLVGAA